MLTIAGHILTVLAVMAARGVLKLAARPFQAVYRRIPSRAAA